jgi:hypothetical protein
MDNPGLFYVDFQKYSFGSVFLDRKIIFSYLYPPEKIASVEKKITDRIESIILTANSLSTLYEKEVLLHDYLVSNVKYEYADKSYHKAHSAVGALLHGRAVCEGYAMAFKLLCDAVGISNIILYGTATNSDGTGNHAWNIVKLNGKCYHIDVTWDGCSTVGGLPNHNCFNLTDEDICQDHTWDRGLLPSCVSLDDNYYVRSGCFFTNSEAMRKYIVSGLKSGQRSFSLKINHKFRDDSRIRKIIQESMRSLFLTSLIGYSYQLQYDSKRDVINVTFHTAI